MARDEITVRVLSFDTVIGLAYRTVRPDAGGVVNAWAGKYGERGALRQFLVDSAKAAHPRAVTTEAIVGAVIQQFSIVIGTPQELKKLRDCVRMRLSEMQRKEGFLTSHKIGKTTRAWCWGSGPTLFELAAISAEPGKPCDQEADPPTEKWLLNELAAARRDLAKVQRQLEQAEKAALCLRQSVSDQVALCALLQTALRLAAGPVDSTGLVVRTHRSYGGRGSLRNWLRRTLKESAPLPIDSKTLLNQAMADLLISQYFSAAALGGFRASR